MRKVYEPEQWNNAQAQASLLKDDDNFETAVVISQTNTKNSEKTGFYKYGLKVNDKEEIARYIAEDTLITLAKQSGNYTEEKVGNKKTGKYAVDFTKLPLKIEAGEILAVN